MKTHLALILAALVSVTALAETPEQIAADYRSKAAAALEKVNVTLEKATVPLIADLVKAGDTAGADELKTQLKAKQDGEPVIKPHAKAVNLFVLYDAARKKALDPAQKAAVARIDDMLASSDGKKLEIVEALGKVRGEVEAGKNIKSSMAWTYHVDPDAKPTAEMNLQPNGVAEWKDGGKTGEIKVGKWKPKSGGFLVQILNEEWNMRVEGASATIERPNVGTRYFRLKL